MTLKQIEAFYWAGICRNFAVAADRLCISVSSLSKRISELEASLGTELFDRSSRNASLTAKGEDLLGFARTVLHHAEQFKERANKQSAISGRCRFGMGEISSLTWMPKLISLIQRNHPLLVVEPDIGLGQVLEVKLEEGEIDFAVIAGRSTRAAIASHVVGAVKFSWVCSPTLRQTIKPTADAAFDDAILITMPNTAGSIRILDKWLIANNIRTYRRMTCANLGAVAGLLRQGLGIGYLPQQWANRLVTRGDLEFLPEFPPLEPLQYAFQWRRDDTRSLIDEMRALVLASIDFELSTGLI